MSQPLIAKLIFVLFGALLGISFLIYRQCKFKAVEPTGPFAKNQGLVLEFADSPAFVDRLLGKAGTDVGDDNRKSAKLFQKLDFVFIPLYTLFLIFSAIYKSGWPKALPVIGFALLAAIFDVFEDIQILRMISGESTASAKYFGQAKWLFYFATLGLIGYLYFIGILNSGMTKGTFLGALLILVATIGICSILLGGFSVIFFAAILSVIGLTGLAFAPLLSSGIFNNN